MGFKWRNSNVEITVQDSMRADVGSNAVEFIISFVLVPQIFQWFSNWS